MGRRNTSEEVFKITAEAQLQDLQRVTATLGDVEASIRDLDGAGSAAGQGADEAGAGIGRMADFAIAATGVIAALGAAMGGLNMAAGFVGGILDASAATNLLEAQTGLTGDALAELVDIGDEIFKGNWGDSLDDVHDALQRVRNITGAEGEELQALTTHALAFADIHGSDVVESVRAADTVMEAFGLDGTAAFDVLQLAMERTGDPAGDLLDTFNEYSGNFAELGLTADQTLRLIDSGLEGNVRNTDDIADAMREFKIRLLDTEGGVEDFINAFPDDFDDQGFFTDLQGGFADGADSIQFTLDAIRELDDESARALGVAAFGTRFEDMGLEAFRAMSLAGGSIEELEGSMTDAENAVSRGIGPAFESLKRTVGIELTRALEDPVVALSEKLIPAMTELGNWFEEDGAPAIEDFMLFMESDGIPAIIGFAEAFEDVMTAGQGFQSLFSALGGAASFSIDVGGDFLDQVQGEGLGNAILGNLESVGEAAGSFVTDTLAPGIIAELGNTANWTAASELSQDILNVAADGTVDVITFIHDNITMPVLDALTDTENWSRAAEVAGVIFGAIGGEVQTAGASGLSSAAGFVSTNIVDPILGAITDPKNWVGAATLATDLLALATPNPETVLSEATSWVSDNIIGPIADALSDPETAVANLQAGADAILGAITSALFGGGEDQPGPGGEGGGLVSAVAGFGDALLGALAGTLPDGDALLTWADENFISPIISALSGLPAALANAINEGIPNSVDIDIPISVGSFSYQGIGFGGFSTSVGASIDLPDNPIPVEPRAHGGPVLAGRPYLVGEQGVELFTPGQSGMISPNGSFGGGDIYLDGVKVGKVLDNMRRNRG